MRAWLEVVEPRGADRALDLQRDFYVGRKKSNDLVISLPALAESQFIVRYEKAGWRLIDLHGTPESRILINDARMVDRHRLQDGDVISIGGLRVRFREEQAAPTHTFDALRETPDDDTLWHMHADELQERGDAFGEYLTRALRGEAPDRGPWLDDVFRRESLYGSLRLTWRRGVIESAIMRRRDAHETFDLAHFRLLVQSRVGQFLRHLTIEAGAPEVADQLARLPELPPTLETLQLGYRLGPVLQAHAAPAALKQRCPRLRDAPVFFTTPGVKLKNEQQTVVLRRASRLVRTADGGWAVRDIQPGVGLAEFRVDDGCFWVNVFGDVHLNAHRLTMPMRLLPGDELSLHTGERFQVEPDDGVPDG